MSTRKVKDAVDVETNEVIYFKGHAKATFMSDGKTVEDTINNILINGGGGGNGGGDIDLSQYATKLELNAKQDEITDLDTIRQGAAKGATALQSYAETDPVFKASAAAGINTTDISKWNAKQDKLESGINIKTINGVSILGDGDIVIESSSDTKEVYIGNSQPTDEGYELWIDEDEEGDVFMIDDSMSDTSTNAVQNRVIKQYMDSAIGDIASILDVINGEVV